MIRESVAAVEVMDSGEIRLMPEGGWPPILYHGFCGTSTLISSEPIETNHSFVVGKKTPWGRSTLDPRPRAGKTEARCMSSPHKTQKSKRHQTCRTHRGSGDPEQAAYWVHPHEDNDAAIRGT